MNAGVAPSNSSKICGMLATGVSISAARAIASYAPLPASLMMVAMAMTAIYTMATAAPCDGATTLGKSLGTSFEVLRDALGIVALLKVAELVVTDPAFIPTAVQWATPGLLLVAKGTLALGPTLMPLVITIGALAMARLAGLAIRTIFTGEVTPPPPGRPIMRNQEVQHGEAVAVN
ncbi:MAG: hypothetical protein ACOYKZ_06345 [Chlamydiia bacterium]